jgi:hypothetical protein
MADQPRDPAVDELAPRPGEDREDEHERVRASNDLDQELEREGVTSRHNRGYDEAVRGDANSDSGGIEDVERVTDTE